MNTSNVKNRLQLNQEKGEDDKAALSWESRVWKRFRRHRLAVIGLCILTVLVLVAIAAPWLSSHDPNRMDLTERVQRPSAKHWLGTDTAGRDVFTRLLYGARVSLAVGFAAVTISTAIGVVLGGISGAYGGWVDNLVMRFTDIIMCFPTFIAMLTMVAVLRPSILNLMIIIGLFSWQGKCRLVRGQLLSLRELQFVEAARCVGVPTRWVIFRHLLPNAVAPVIVAATFSVGGAILSEAGLSFLGVGIQMPTASLGNMLNVATNLSSLLTMPWLWLPPGLAIMAIVLAINFTGDGLRDALDPRMDIR